MLTVVDVNRVKVWLQDVRKADEGEYADDMALMLLEDKLDSFVNEISKTEGYLK